MRIEKNKVVSLVYDLKSESHEGEMIESVDKDNAMQFLYGNGMMLPAFEENIKGLSKGDKFQFKLAFDEAYGEFSEDSVVEIPKSAFEVEGVIEDGLLEEDNVIPLQDEQGNRFNGRVEKVLEEFVVIDFNHPLAGEDLYFTGEVFEIRDATAEELSHGHVHGHGHHHNH
jgi:FKBP-type peptidyl-prolyl cis-trans isomerase SlyD